MEYFVGNNIGGYTAVCYLLFVRVVSVNPQEMKTKIYSIKKAPKHQITRTPV